MFYEQALGTFQPLPFFYLEKHMRPYRIVINDRITMYFSMFRERICVDITDEHGYCHPMHLSYKEFEQIAGAYFSRSLPERTTIDPSSESQLM